MASTVINLSIYILYYTIPICLSNLVLFRAKCSTCRSAYPSKESSVRNEWLKFIFNKVLFRLIFFQRFVRAISTNYLKIYILTVFGIDKQFTDTINLSFMFSQLMFHISLSLCIRLFSPFVPLCWNQPLRTLPPILMPSLFTLMLEARS